MLWWKAFVVNSFFFLDSKSINLHVILPQLKLNVRVTGGLREGLLFAALSV